MTLDNTNPVTMCAAFKNSSGISVEVTTVGLSSPEVEFESWRCAEDDNIKEFGAYRACKPGVTLRAGGNGCYVGITAKAGSPPEEYKSTVSVTVKGRCVTVTVNPCSAPELQASPPTPAKPVDVKWTTRVAGVCYQVSEPDPDPFCA